MVALARELIELSSEYQPLILRGDPNGLAYDAHADALYVADGHGGAILRIEEAHTQRIASIDSGGVVATNRIGGLAITPYGTLFASRLGYGRAGAIFRIEPDGSIEELAHLPTHVWRLGLAYDPYSHALYSAQFLKAETGPYGGSIVAHDLATGTARTIVDGLAKPVGVVRTEDMLVVSDAKARRVMCFDMDGDRAVLCAQFAFGGHRPDSICACGPDAVLVTTFDTNARQGRVVRQWFDGRTQTIGAGHWEPRGVTTDGDRVYVASRRAGRVLVFPLTSN